MVMSATLMRVVVLVFSARVVVVLVRVTAVGASLTSVTVRVKLVVTSGVLPTVEVNAQTVGALIALYERAVGLYASLVNINAYHQPGVEAGKKAAAVILDLQQKVSGQFRG